MNKIIINHGSFKVKEVELEHGTLTVGRAADNDLKLDDSAVSSHHAKLVTFFNVTYIEDLNSTNGTLVNGRPVKKYTLHTGDIVLLGKHQLRFEGARMDETANSDSTIIMSQSEKDDALANVSDMKKADHAAPSPSVNKAIPNTSKIPMKQDHQEPIGRLNTGAFQEPSGFSQNHSPSRSNNTPAGNNGGSLGNRDKTFQRSSDRDNSALDTLVAPQSRAPQRPANHDATIQAPANRTPVTNEALGARMTPTTNKAPEANNLFRDTPESIPSKPNASEQPAPNASANPFKAAFPDDSADKIDVNDVPGIGDVDLVSNTGKSQGNADKVTAIGGENLDSPDSSQANLYSVQALSQASAEADTADADSQLAKHDFRAQIPVDGDESLLIPAFAKKLSHPGAANAKPSFASVSKINEHSEQKISPEIEKLFEQEEAARKAKPVRKVLEDPSVSMGDDFQGMTPVGLSENNRISQYQQRAAASHDIPAVGDRTLLKQIITGDRDFSPSRNKFEIIQIVLGVVIVVIIALIAIASL